LFPLYADPDRSLIVLPFLFTGIFDDFAEEGVFKVELKFLSISLVAASFDDENPIFFKNS